MGTVATLTERLDRLTERIDGLERALKIVVRFTVGAPGRHLVERDQAAARELYALLGVTSEAPSDVRRPDGQVNHSAVMVEQWRDARDRERALGHHDLVRIYTDKLRAVGAE
jgi:hypothetical protein